MKRAIRKLHHTEYESGVAFEIVSVKSEAQYLSDDYPRLLM